jgi:hypothetical protein
MGSFGVDIDAVAETFVKLASKMAATKISYTPHNKTYPKADSGLVSFVGLYLGRFGKNDKKVRDALFGANLDVFSIYENGFKGGNTVEALTAESKRYFVKGKGKTDGTQAVAWARQADQPHKAPIFFAVDTNPCLVGKNIYDVNDKVTKEVFLEYFSEVKASVGSAFPIGCYGTDFLLQWLHEEKLASYLWQTCSTSRRGDGIKVAREAKPSRKPWR